MAARKKSAKTKKASSVKKSPVAKKRKAAPKAAKRAVKRATTKKAAGSTKASGGPISVGRKPFTKSEFVSTISAQTGVARKEVVSVLETIARIIDAHLQKQGPEIFSWPGMLKIKVVKKPATKARQGVNPFTGETMTFKAKPASRRVKVLPLKQLKEMAS